MPLTGSMSPPRGWTAAQLWLAHGTRTVEFRVLELLLRFNPTERNKTAPDAGSRVLSGDPFLCSDPTGPRFHFFLLIQRASH